MWLLIKALEGVCTKLSFLRIFIKQRWRSDQMVQQRLKDYDAIKTTKQVLMKFMCIEAGFTVN
jgi:hypothetical protein